MNQQKEGIEAPAVKKSQRGLFSSIINHKCPRCREGDLFLNKALSFRKPFKMPANCPNCNQSFVLEPGFFWGAMYVDYALSSMVMLSGFAVVFFVFHKGIFFSFGVALALCMLLYIFIFRLGRSMWIHMFVKPSPRYVGPERSGHLDREEA